MRGIFVSVVVIMALSTAVSAAEIHSDLWGKSGEAWTPRSRLPDFSFAGYRFGEVPLPKPDIVADVKKYGAKGDGTTDDTAAFKKAIEEAKNGTIFIPEGLYVITDILWIQKPNIVLRGAGPEKTILHFPKTLEDVRPNMSKTTSGRPTSGYSWSGGFVWAKGSTRGKVISKIVSDAKRGDTELTLESAGDLKEGQRVQIRMQDTADKSLLNHLYAGSNGGVKKITKPISVDFVSPVVAVKGNTITLARPLRWDVRSEWTPELCTFTATVSEVGVEELSFSFPVKPYKGHFTELGMNAVAMNGVSDCWVRNVHISNCDSGLFIGGKFCTIDGLRIDGVRKPSRGDTGHHGVTLGQDCLMENFEIRAKFIHDITVSNRQAGNVFKNGKGTNLSFDHHKRAPYENLFTNIDVGDGGQVWRCGGGRDLGHNCAARGTFWCIRSKKAIGWPPKRFSPDLINVVGVKTEAQSIKDEKGKWFEAIPPDQLVPKDLHAAQLKRRLEK